MVRRMRPALVLLAAAVVAIGAALTFVAGRFSPERYKPAIEAAVKHATGRDLVVRGPATLSFGWSPVLVLQDLTLANAEGGSRREMATVGRADAELSLLPLIFGRLVVNRLTLVHPDILLERSAHGEPNWHLSPFVPGQPLPDAAELPESGPRPDIGIAALRIMD
ncbi:MAG: AsmA family protein, partial [Acetobacteraceae bacterium]|nr:AsmA family protein [Acetobacteraceae bacterium]